MPKSRSSRRSRKGRKQTVKPAGQEATRAVAQPVAVAEAGVAPSTTAPRERAPSSKMSRRDYSYVRRDLRRIVVLATAVLITIVVLSFFIP